MTVTLLKQMISIQFTKNLMLCLNVISLTVQLIIFITVDVKEPSMACKNESRRSFASKNSVFYDPVVLLLIYSVERMEGFPEILFLSIDWLNIMSLKTVCTSMNSLYCDACTFNCLKLNNLVNYSVRCPLVGVFVVDTHSASASCN